MKRIASKLSVASILFLGSSWLFVLVARRALPPRDDRERGDVPGWVMITLMSAILVAGLLAIATPALTDLFNQAMSKVGK
jgi:ABC-type transport system involved in cytochrome c biogenesis permease subunit